MSEKQDLNLGEIIADESAARDAIHIAVAPVVAAMRLSPGQRVGLTPDGRAVAYRPARDEIGIVDPYLTGAVFEGERFWLFLFPNTITGLRHEWEHPAFGEMDGKQRRSERWLKNFADEWEMDFDEMVQEALGGSLCFGEDDHPRGECAVEEFYDHLDCYLGRRVPRGYFRCAC